MTDRTTFSQADMQRAIRAAEACGKETRDERLDRTMTIVPLDELRAAATPQKDATP